MKKLILASSAPSRRALLERLSIPFEAISPHVDEKAWERNITDPVQLTQTLAIQKAKSVFAHYQKRNSQQNITVIGADQLAHLQGQILGKPLSKEKAVEQLSSLRGKTHELITSVSICGRQQATQWTHIDYLTMRPLGKEQIEYYLQQDAPFQCAGSYRLEKSGIALFDRISTSDYTAIIGLPLIELSKRLTSFGFPLFQ